MKHKKYKEGDFARFRKSKKCVNPDGKGICNLGYACDGCPRNDPVINRNTNIDGGDPRDVSRKKTKKMYIEVLAQPNNCFVKEWCIFGHIFNADNVTIFGIDGFGWICYDCFARLKIRRGLDGKRKNKHN